MSPYIRIFTIVLFFPILILSYQNCSKSTVGKSLTSGIGEVPMVPPAGPAATEIQSTCLIEIVNPVGDFSFGPIAPVLQTFPVNDTASVDSEKKACLYRAAQASKDFCNANTTNQFSLANTKAVFSTKTNIQLVAEALQNVTYYYDICQVGQPFGSCAITGGVTDGNLCNANDLCCSNDCQISGDFGTCAGSGIPTPPTTCELSGKRCVSDSDCCAGLVCQGAGGISACIPPVITKKFKLSVSKDAPLSGTVVSSPSGISCGVTCESYFDENQMVTLTAAGNPGFVLSSWSGDCSGSSASTTVTLAAAKSCQAIFSAIPTFNISVSKTGSGSVVSDVGGINCGTLCSAAVQTGTTVTLTAAPSVGYVFSSWSGACAGTSLVSTVIVSADESCSANFIPETFTLDVVLVSGSGTITSAPVGINCPGTCQFVYETQTAINMSAVPDSGFQAAVFGGDCSSLGQVTMDTNKSCTVVFAPIPVFNLDVSKTGSGTVVSSLGGISCGGVCSASFFSNTSLSLTANADPNFIFTSWSGACSGGATSNVVMTSDLSCTANFAPIMFNVSAVTVGSGVVTTDFGGLNCGSTCSGNVQSGTSVSFTATSSPGFSFSGWAGDCAGSTSPVSVLVSNDVSCTATFDPVMHTLAVSNNGMGVVTSDLGGINCGMICSWLYQEGNSVVLTATPDIGQVFTGWTGDCSSLALSTTVPVTADASCTANYTPSTLTLTMTNNSAGTITSDVGGINCGVTCVTSLPYGSVVNVTAAPNFGFGFASWSGDCSGTSPTTAITLTSSSTCAATYAPLMNTLNVSKIGMGTITSDVGGINCGPTCSAIVQLGTTVNLTAVPDFGFEFSAWTGQCSGSSPTTSVVVSGFPSCVATFMASPFTLTVVKAGAGIGTVTSSIGGINCGLTCSAILPFGVNVTLDASVPPGNIFSGWSGACSGSTPSIVVTMAGNISCTATFAPILFNMNVLKVGMGTVTSSIGGINCGLTCLAPIQSGFNVTLTATPAPGYTFTIWSGDCSGSVAATNVLMSSAKTCTAQFMLIVYNLTVITSGSGTVTSDVGGINCGTSCLSTYDEGTTVALTATPSPGYMFSGWAGSCSGSASPLSIMMDSAKSCTANFTPIIYTLSVSKTGLGTITSDVGGINFGSVSSGGVPMGTTVTLTAVPATGYSFSTWGGACSGIGLSTSVLVTGPTNCTALFTINNYTLMVTKVGSGTVTSSVGGINCGLACNGTVPFGTSVTLTEVPASGMIFAGWGGGCSGIGSTTTVIVNANTTCTATFTACPVSGSPAIGGYCFYLGANSQSCNTRCAAMGKTCSAAGMTYAGGSTATCGAIGATLNAISATGGNYSSTVGCSYHATMARWRVGTTKSCTGTSTSNAPACPCQ